MADKTHIEWTDATWNPVTGCGKVSAGCKHCYAARDWVRLSANKGTRYYRRDFTDVQCHEDVLTLPLRWTKPRRIFVNSMSDLFHPGVDREFIARVFAMMGASAHHQFQVLTKRPERMRDLLSDSDFQGEVTDGWGGECRELAWPPPNVWLGVSVEDQSMANERIPMLLQTPAAVRWVSAEPLLGPVDLRPYLDWSFANADMSRPDLDWVVAGGESGPKARPMHPDWARSLRDQCAGAGTPFLFKQWGEFVPAVLDRKDDEPEPWRVTPDGDRSWSFAEALKPAEQWPAVVMLRYGKKAAGRLLDGKRHDGYPEASNCWQQGDHYDICKAKRTPAIAAGAGEIRRQSRQRP